MANFALTIMLVFFSENALVNSIDRIKYQIIGVYGLSFVCFVELLATIATLDSLTDILTEAPCVALELVLQLFMIKSTWLLTRGTFNSLRHALRQFEMIFIMRNLRIGSLLSEVKMFNIIYEFMFRMSKPLVV
jgi:hypothetical protein